MRNVCIPKAGRLVARSSPLDALYCEPIEPNYLFIETVCSGLPAAIHIQPKIERRRCGARWTVASLQEAAEIILNGRMAMDERLHTDVALRA
jgi:hypothetical protein